MKNSIIVSSTCFEQPSFHPQEDLYMQFNGIFHGEIVIEGCMNCLKYKILSSFNLKSKPFYTLINSV